LAAPLDVGELSRAAMRVSSMRRIQLKNRCIRRSTGFKK
jgi:hypothetical protein